MRWRRQRNGWQRYIAPRTIKVQVMLVVVLTSLAAAVLLNVKPSAVSDLVWVASESVTLSGLLWNAYVLSWKSRRNRKYRQLLQVRERREHQEELEEERKRMYELQSDVAASALPALLPFLPVKGYESRPSYVPLEPMPTDSPNYVWDGWQWVRFRSFGESEDVDAK